MESEKAKALEFGLNHLTLLTEYLKNPDLISSLTDDIKKLNDVTEEEKKKASDIRFFIENNQEILAEFNRRVAEFNERNEDLRIRILDHEQEVIRVKKLESEMMDLSAKLAEIDGQQKGEYAKIEAFRAKVEKQNIEEREKIRRDLSVAKEQKAYNDLEVTRLQNYEKSLKEQSEAILKKITQQG